MVLGSLHRTAVRWDLPQNINALLRQIGLMIFLACVGLATGPAFISQALSIAGLKLVGAVGREPRPRWGDPAGRGPADRIVRAARGRQVAGFVGQPAVLSYATR